ncbi:MAG TPA: class I SAM-dependent methyltransferase, partial [Chitinophagaceae bacterium]|nr:class I SAM-dependent methyltransferase [Chitinophagaceae bacterium]
ALLVLEMTKEAMHFRVMLKDATPYNIQWRNGKPVFIDTLSFAKYDASKPWIAYRQFCENFVSPLVLMHHRSQPLQPMLLAYPEGIPLTITRSLLPWTSFFFFYTYLHVHLHSKWSLKKVANTPVTQTTFSEKKMTQILESLTALVQKKKWKDKPTTWNQYYDEACLRDDYIVNKKEIIRKWLTELDFNSAIDLGANTGEFSFLLAEKNMPVIAVDSDHSAINKLFEKVKTEGKNILPLVIDLANPSPAIGLNNKERPSFIDRTNVDLALVLALVHHLAIGKNIPFAQISKLLQKITDHVIIEFVPKEDAKVQLMLRQKEDIYYDYNEENFQKAFSNHFNIREKKQVPGSSRFLYLMTKK